MGKRFGLFQITQMTGLFDDLKLTILGCSQQCCLPFPVRLVVFSIDDEDWAWEGPKHRREVVGCQFAVSTSGERTPEKHLTSILVICHTPYESDEAPFCV